MPALFDPLTLGGVRFANRAWLSSMCQYSCEAGDGVPTDWHRVHLGSRAIGGFGLVMTEASAVLPEGRISPQDAGIWNDAQASAWCRIVDFCHDHGARTGVQLAHAGRKASARRPFPGEPRGAVPPTEGGWCPVAPSALAYPGLADPEALSAAGIRQVIDAFAAAARRAVAAGFDVVEVHAAHGYLLHQFCSPLSNLRSDAWGGDFAGRTRLVREVAAAVRAEVPDDRALFVRISATDWAEGGWDIPDSVRLAGDLKALGVQLIDVSSGGNVHGVAVRQAPGYLVDYATAVRAAGVPASAVGLITEPTQAEAIITEGRADAVFLARAALRDPYWPLRAAHELGATPGFPAQYVRGAW